MNKQQLPAVGGNSTVGNAHKQQLKIFTSVLPIMPCLSPLLHYLLFRGRARATHSLVHPLGCRVQQIYHRTQILNLIFNFLAPLTQKCVRYQPVCQYSSCKNLNKSCLLRPSENCFKINSGLRGHLPRSNAQFVMERICNYLWHTS